METLFWITLLITTCIISYQDFTERLISVWILALYSGVLLFGFFLKGFNCYDLLENIKFCLLYFCFTYLIIHLYYFIKIGSFVKIMGKMIGWGDVWVLLSLALIQDPIHSNFLLIIGIIATLIFAVLFKKTNQEIPLAGVYVIVSYPFLFLTYNIQLAISLV